MVVRHPSRMVWFLHFDDVQLHETVHEVLKMRSLEQNVPQYTYPLRKFHRLHLDKKYGKE